jgi:hypothetical protein
MAISYRSGNVGAGGNSVVITTPAGVVAGDVLVACIWTDGLNVTPPVGWVDPQTITSGGASGSNVFSFYKVAVAGEPASYTFVCTGGAVSQGLVDAYIGVDNTTPMDAAATVVGGAVATITWPSITTVTNNAWHLALAGDGISSTIPATYTGRSVSTTFCRNSDKVISPAGVVSGVTATSGSSDWGVFSRVLRPAAGAPLVVRPNPPRVVLQAMNRGGL